MNRLSECALYDQRGFRRNYFDPTIGSTVADEVTGTNVRTWMIDLATLDERASPEECRAIVISAS
ncbi:MAG: hypothetical protein OEV40_08115 [Acidimicrobiia bacterium]|nr:hypothetical protein [Acidimicrobiia bacterium]